MPTVVAVLCLLAALATGLRPELLAWAALLPTGVLLGLVDARVHRLPDVLTLPAAAAALVLLGTASLLPGVGGTWTGSLYGALALGGLFLVMFLASPRAMGFGDVKLAPTLGAVLGWYGWPTLVLGVIAGYLIAAVYGLALIARGRATSRTNVPFGPPLLLGTLLAAAASSLLA